MRAILAVALALLLAGGSLAVAVPSRLPVRESLLIDGDDALAASDAVRGGSGTAADPYRVAGWRIVQDTWYGIRIVNTTRHVVVENVEIVGPEASLQRASCGLACPPPRGIEVVDAANVTIRAVHVASSSWGVKLLRVHDARLEDVRVGFGRPDAGLSTYGVEAIGGGNITLARLHVFALHPLLVGANADVAILDSRFGPNLGVHESFVTVSNARRILIEGSVFDGVALSLTERVEELTVARSTFAGPSAQLRGSMSITHALRDATFCGNVFSGSRRDDGALFLRSADGVHVVGNEFAGNTKGFDIQFAQNVTFVGNHVHDSSRRGGVLQSEGAQVNDNGFERNGLGITLSRPMDATWNWWGDPSGPSGSGPGAGDRLAAGPGVVFSPWSDAPPLRHGCP